jgi:hypothetical protein
VPQQRKQETLIDHLRVLLLRGEQQTSYHFARPPTDATLTALHPLWIELRDKERFRDRMILIFWAALTLLQFTACAACGYGASNFFPTLLICVCLASPIPITMLCRKRKPLKDCRELLRNTADEAMGRDCVVPLLDLLAAPGLETVRARLTAALTRTLPKFTGDEARNLTWQQRDTLSTILRQGNVDPELLIAGFLVLGEAKEPSLREFAELLLQTNQNDRVTEAAADYLKQIK